MPTYVRPARGTPGGAQYGTYTKFGMGMYEGMGAKEQKAAGAKAGAGAWAVGIDPAAPDAEAQVERYLARYRNPDGTYHDARGNPSNWMNRINQIIAENPGVSKLGAFDAAYRMQMTESSRPPTNFFTEYLLDPLVEIALGAGGNLLVPGLGTVAAVGYGAGRGASENGIVGGLLGGLGGYTAGTLGTNVLSGIVRAGGVGNYLSGLGTSAYNAVAHLPSTLSNLGRSALGTLQYGPELTNLNAALLNTAPWAAQGMAAGASGAMRIAADAANAGAGGFVNNLLPSASRAATVGQLGSSAANAGTGGFFGNLLPGASRAATIGQLGSSAVGGGGMEWRDLISFGKDIALPVYLASRTEEALRSGAAGQTSAINSSTALQREMFERGIELNKPWYEAGTNALAEQQRLLGLGPTGRGTPGYGSLAKPFSQTAFRADPGYAFRMAEGQKAVERSAAARGGLLSGRTGMELTRYGQNMASQEYQNAFDRYYIEMANRLKPLQSLSGTGQSTAETLGERGANYATNAGQNAVDLATVRANQNITSTALQNQLINQIVGRVSSYGQPQQPFYYGA